VIVSTGHYDAPSSIVVTDLAGRYVTTLDGGHAAEGIAISGGTLYAALDADHAVGAIEIATIRQATPTQTLYPLSNSNELPYDLALESGKLWVSYDEGAGSGAIGDIDVTAADPTFAPAVLSGPGWYWAPELAADPSNHGFLAAATPGEMPTTMATYDVAGSSTAPLAQTTPFNFDNCPTSELGIAVAAGGATFMLICDGFSGASVFYTDSLAPDGSYGAFPDAALAGAVAVAPDGAIAVAGSGGISPGATYIRTFTATGTALNAYQYSFARSVMTNGLAWSADGTRLYAVLVTSENRNPANPTYSLRIINNAVRPTIRLTGTSRAAYGSPVLLHGTVAAGTTPPPAGTHVTITRTARKGIPSVTVFTASTTANGRFRLADRTHLAPGRYTYTASYGTTSTTHAVTITRARAVVALALHGFYATSRHGSTMYRLYHRSGRVRATVKVTPKMPRGCVRLEVQEHYRGKWHARLSTRCAALSSTSKLTASIAASNEAPGQPYRIRAVLVPGRHATVSGADSGWQYFVIER
jgi:hypothetical protein